MQTIVYRTPIKGRLVLMIWGALLGLVGFAVLQLWRTTLAFYALLGWGLLLGILWWRSGFFVAELQFPTAHAAARASTAAPAAHTPAKHGTLMLHRGRWLRADDCIPYHCIYADALLSTPLLRLADCRLLVYYTAGRTFVLPPLATAQANEIAMQCRQ